VTSLQKICGFYFADNGITFNNFMNEFRFKDLLCLGVMALSSLTEGYCTLTYSICSAIGTKILEFIPSQCHTIISSFPVKYRGADKSLARPGRKQATATED
jgi:hypothetical protein